MENQTEILNLSLKNKIKNRVKKFLRLDQIRDQLKSLHHHQENLHHDQLMPKYLYHAPLDYSTESHPPEFGTSILLPGQSIPIPPSNCRPGYAPDDDQLYLRWGKSDHDFIMKIVEKHYGVKRDISILDFGCSSGRVLRHFDQERRDLNWNLKGTDIQAFLVEWMRQYFPPEFEVLCGTSYPHLPFEDNSLDIIFGISVFTHTKYLWDTWLMEFKRVLKPGGLCMQTIQCETAWKFYHENRNTDWVKSGHPQSMLAKPAMDEDFFFYGDGHCSQIFFKEEVAKKYWNRYLEVVDFLPPPEFGYQNWIVAKKQLKFDN